MQSGPGFIPTFLYYFVGTTFIVAIVVSQGLEQSELLATVGNPFRVGVLFGLFAGGVGAYFNSHDQIEITVKNQKVSQKKLLDTLETLNYEEKQVVDSVKIYARSFPSNIFSGNVSVQFDGNTALISGRSNTLRLLQKRFEQT